MSKITNWSRKDELYSNSKIIAAWEHDRIAQRAFVEKRETRRGQTFYTVQQQNFPNGFDGHGYIEEVDNPDWDTRDEALEAARRHLKRNPDGLTILGLPDTDASDLPTHSESSQEYEIILTEDEWDEVEDAGIAMPEPVGMKKEADGWHFIVEEDKLDELNGVVDTAAIEVN